MMPKIEYPLSEHLAWVQWWACPWQNAHEDWKEGQHATFNTLYQGKQPVWGVFMGVKACLPPATNPTVLRLALASSEQLDLALTLAHDTVNPHAAPTLSESHHHWCRRLSKALPPAMLSPDADPLQLLLSWLDPPIWQRLRLRFPRQRTYEVEKKSICLENTSNRLSTLWQAVVWRVTSLPSDSTPPGTHG